MPNATLTGARRFEFARVGFDSVDQIVEVLIGRIGTHCHTCGVDVHECDGGVVGGRELGQTSPVHHRNFYRDHAQGVTIGCCSGNR